METLLTDEFRLAYALLLQAAALAGAWRFVRRRVGADGFDRAADVLLLTFLIQYAAVTLPGLAGVLSPLTIGAVTLALSAASFFAPAKVGPAGETEAVGTPLDRWALIACSLFTAGYVATLAWEQRLVPVLAQDALTYHFPAAVRWLQTGRLPLFETWYFNPANTYSPLAGSTFIAWWIAPLGNDVLARHVQAPALLLVFFAAVRLMRAVGVRPAVAAVIGLALILSQALLRQAIMEKDDLYLVAFFTCCVAGCAADRLRDPLGPWRLGVSLGLLLATKYTALLALPALLLLIDAPARARWPVRRYAILIAAVVVIAGPWYLRNILLTGNPVYPIEVKVFGRTLFGGLFETARSERLAGPGALWNVLTLRDQGLPAWPLRIALLGLIAAWAGRYRRVVGDPLARACLLGPIVMVLLFWWTAPYAEVRFVYPAFVLLYAAVAVAIAAWLRHVGLQLLAAVTVLVPSWATGFDLRVAGDVVAEMVAVATLVTLAGAAVAWAVIRLPSKRRAILGAGAATAALLLGGSAFVFWHALVEESRLTAIPRFYGPFYGDLAQAWGFVDEKLPPGEILAYANTFLVHPLGGFGHERRLVYVPTRRGVAHVHDLPRLPGRLPGERLEPAFVAAMTADTDAEGWLARLKASGATHLFVARRGPVPSPPELAIVAAHPERFEPLFENPAAWVYRIK